MQSRVPIRRLGVSLTAMALLVGIAAPPVGADDISESKGFRKGVTLAGIREHQAAFQAIATATGGSRVSSSPGYLASRDYVVDRLEAAGYEVTVQAFPFAFDGDATPPVLAQISPNPTTYVDGVDFDTMQYSGSGDRTAPLVAVDLAIPTAVANTSTSGCEAADFAGFPAGSIALMQRGTCPFAQKAVNAQAAGAVGALVYNEGTLGDPARNNLVTGTLGAPGVVTIPVDGLTYALGNTLRNGVLNGPTGLTMRIRNDILVDIRTTWNVWAETAGGDPNRVVVVGAHLDSVTRGPGINDNGSGSATILEIAEVFAAQDRDPRNKLRFMWYGAEEFGLLGSEYYVADLSAAEQDRIMAMVNFDMVGSPNFARFVYDGDNSDFPPVAGQVAEGPPGSAHLEDLFVDYFNAVGLSSDPTPFSGRSDYGPFIEVGIPSGGLFTGAEGIKSAAQAAEFGGTAGVAYDPCYHLACDTYDNNSNTGLDQMSDAAAHVVLTLSRTKVDVRLTEASAALRTSGTLQAVGYHDHAEDAVIDR
jgi:Zn-dependent M28 family amino/carboxypeptidase